MTYDPLDGLIDMYMERGMTEYEAIGQLKEDALKGREIRKQELDELIEEKE
jgi:hypothetical protein